MTNIDLLFSAFNNTTPGCSFVVVQNGEIILEKSFGLANKEKNIPITSQTAFRLASLTKPFTAMAIMMLKEKNLLSFDDTVEKFFPEFPNYGKNITIRQLLTHTSGIPDHEQPLYRKIKSGEELTMYDALEVLKQENELLFPSGTKYTYSDAGFVVLALIIENVSGQRYARFLAENVFVPLKMVNTIVVDETKPKIKSRAYGYKNVEGGYELFDYDPLNFIIGDEGIYSTTLDLVKWWQAWRTDVLVSNKTLQEALTPQALLDGSVEQCGFSWFIRKIDNRNIIFHDGYWVGFNNIILTDMDTDTTVILLSNTTKYPFEEKRLNIALAILNETLPAVSC